MAQTSKVVTIIRGEDKQFTLGLRKKSDPTEPQPLTGITAASLKLEKEDGTVLELTLASGLVVTSELGGKIAVTVTDAQSQVLKPEEKQDFELTYDVGSTRTKVQFLDALTVLKSIDEE